MDNVIGYIWLVGFILVSILAIYGLNDYSNNIEQLAQSICDQEYDMDYDSYSNKELKCKPREQKESYDRIVVEIGNKPKMIMVEGPGVVTKLPTEENPYYVIKINNQKEVQ